MSPYFRESGTVNLLKNLNTEKVFKQILLKGSVSRAQISQLTGMNKVTVSKCIDFLLKQHIVKETGIVEADFGRPPIMLSLREDFGLFIGIEINHIANVILISDIKGNPLERNLLPDFGGDPVKFFEALPEILQSYLKKYNFTKHGYVGLGIALPTNYNRKTDTVENIYSMPKWKGIHVKQELDKRFPNMKISVMVASEAGAIGEIHFGCSTPFEHLAYLYGTWGITLSVYSAGSMYMGTSGFAGRFGHTIVESAGRPCVCGNCGCLEAYSSVRPLIKKFYPDDGYVKEHVFDIIGRIRKNEPAVNEEMECLSRYLSIGIVNILNMYNPDKICIGGYLAKLITKKTLDNVYHSVKHMTLDHYFKGVSICTSKQEEFGPVYGCVATLRDHLIDIVATGKYCLEGR